MRDNKLTSLVFSMRSKNAAGELLDIGYVPKPREITTGRDLLFGHSRLSQMLGKQFGAQQVELGGMMIHNNKLLQTLTSRFEQRQIYIDYYKEMLDYFGKDFPVR